MPKVNLLQESFHGGEFSPMAQGQPSLENYKKGMSKILNYIPTIQGPLVRRPATKFVTVVQNPTPGGSQAPSGKPVLIPFIYSQTQAYMLEFGQGYINFYANNGVVITSSSIFQVSGATDSQINFFYGTRPIYSPKPGEFITASSVIVAPIGVTTPLWLNSPYAQADLPQIKWAQNADTLYLTHPNYPTMKLERFGSLDWRLKQVYFQDGPYLAYNSYAQTGDSSTVTLQCGSSVGGAHTQLVTGPVATVAGTAGAVGGQITITTAAPHGYLNGQKVVVTGITGTTEANTYTSLTTTQPAYWVITVPSLQTMTLIGSKFANSYISGGAVYPALFQASDINRVVGLTVNGQRGWGVITGYTANINNLASFYVDPGNNGNNATFGQPSTISTGVCNTWQMGCYSGQSSYSGVYGGGGSIGSSCFPSSVSFHQNRLCFAGSPKFPQQVDGSEIGLYEVFSPSIMTGSTALQVQQNNAFQFTLSSVDVNPLQWLRSTSQGLVSASYSNEWCITPSTATTALSPTNVNAQQTSFFGAANIDAVTAGNAVLYVQRAQRKLREMNYYFQVGTFRSTDLTEVSEHITLPTISKLCVQKETQPIVWAVRSDGNLVSMTYNPDATAVIGQGAPGGWARQYLGGRSDTAGTNPIVSSIACIPDPTGTYDQMWLVVQRYFNNATTGYSIEYMTNLFNDYTLQEDAFQGDCGVSYDNPYTITSIVQSSVYTIVNFTPAFQVPENGLQFKFVGVDGLNQSFTDVNGLVTTTNAVNYNVFVAGSSASSSFYLQDLYGNFVNTGSSGVYVSGGQFRQMNQNFSGATWLQGETVNVLADGGNHPAVLVGSGGTFALNYPAAKVQLGYAFPSQGQLLRPNSGSAQGSAIGSTRRVHRAAAMLHNAGDWAWGLSFKDLINWNFNQADNNQADTAVPLFTGIIRDGMEAGYDFEGQVCFQQNTMLPGVVQAIVTFMEEFDV
jgi:hypothetical protein